MSNYKVIDADEIESNLSLLRSQLLDLDKIERKTTQEESAILVLRTAIGVLHSTKVQMRSLEAHLGLQPEVDVHPGDGLLDIPESDRNFFNIIDTADTAYEIDPSTKEKNNNLRTIDISLIDGTIGEVAKHIEELTLKGVPNLTEEDEMNFTSLWAQLSTLMEVKN
jgi:hypothetical protein